MAASPVSVLVCEGGAIDSLTGRLTLFNAHDTIFAPTFPALLARLWVVVTYEHGAEPDYFFETMDLRGPGGEVLLRSFSEIKTNPDDISHTSIHNLTNIPFPVAGTYSCVVSRGPTRDGPWTRVCARTLSIRVRPAVVAEVASTGEAPGDPVH